MSRLHAACRHFRQAISADATFSPFHQPLTLRRRQLSPDYARFSPFLRFISPRFDFHAIFDIRHFDFRYCRYADAFHAAIFRVCRCLSLWLPIF
jgi:hypothetical protein